MMVEVFINGFSDRGSTPLISTLCHTSEHQPIIFVTSKVFGIVLELKK